MGWLGLVGSLKLYVFFAKETYKRDDILQKRLMILRSLLIVATLCNTKPSTCTRSLSNASCSTYCAYCRHLSHLSLQIVRIVGLFLYIWFVLKRLSLDTVRISDIFLYNLCVLKRVLCVLKRLSPPSTSPSLSARTVRVNESRHVTNVNESCHTYVCVNELCQTHGC